MLLPFKMTKFYTDFKFEKLTVLPEKRPFLNGLCSGGSRGSRRPPRPQRDPILSLSQMFPLKSIHIGSRHPPLWVGAPQREILDLQLLCVIFVQICHEVTGYGLYFWWKIKGLSTGTSSILPDTYVMTS